MKSFIIPAAILAGAMLTACENRPECTADYNVVPLPREIAVAEGAEGFTLRPGTKIAVDDTAASMTRNAEMLAEWLQPLTGIQAKLTDKVGKGEIILRTGLESDNPEAYTLSVNADNITITGASPAGVFYGMQTLRKAIPTAGEHNVVFPAAEISDMPRFAYRGAHFDTARHFFPVDSIKSFIDMIALHNINRFHWHFTEDQGWRFEVKSRPLLTEVGSKRAGTVIGHNSGVYDSIPYGGYYTQDDAREIVRYAADRHITVIPEIDMPGHMLGALAAYPELGCTGGPYEVWQQWGVSEEVLCAGNDSVLAFIDDVLGELIDVFPSEYIHVGGDECPKVRWKDCPKCQARAKALGFKDDKDGTKEEKLQSFLIHHASDFLTSRGRKMIGWDETLEGGLAPGAVVMSWRGVNGGIAAARMNHDVIMTPNTYFYFDYYQSDDKENEPDAIGGYLPIEKVYSYEPVPDSIFTADEGKHIIGVQANLWTEYMPTFDQVQYMELPRMAALSEIQWTEGKKDYEGFLKRLPQMAEHYKANGYRYAKHVLPDAPKEATEEATEEAAAE